MIVVAGMMGDEPVRVLCGRLLVLQLPYAFVDPVRLMESVELRQTWSRGGEIVGHLRAEGGEPIDFDAVTGVYLRHSDWRTANPSLAEATLDRDEAGILKSEKHMALSTAFDHLDCAVVNRLQTMMSNDAKPVQQLLAMRAGFKTPRALLTSDPDAVLDFRDRCGGKIVSKGIGSMRAKVRLVDDALLERLPYVRSCPTQFQEYVPGPNVRVHVVGRTVHATRIVSDAVDYRYAKSRYEPMELAPEVQVACTALSRKLGLFLSGIDLIEGPDGYYFLEINPSPAYSFFELHAFQAISTSLAELLRDGREVAREWAEAARIEAEPVGTGQVA